MTRISVWKAPRIDAGTRAQGPFVWEVQETSGREWGRDTGRKRQPMRVCVLPATTVEAGA